MSSQGPSSIDHLKIEVQLDSAENVAALLYSCVIVSLAAFTPIAPRQTPKFGHEVFTPKASIAHLATAYPTSVNSRLPVVFQSNLDVQNLRRVRCERSLWRKKTKKKSSHNFIRSGTGVHSIQS